MALIEMNRNPSPRQLRQFAALWFPAACTLLGAMILVRSGALIIPALLWSVGLVVSLVGLIRPSFIKPIFLAWMSIVYPIGWTISHLMLVVVFFVIITPVGLVLRLLGHDPLERSFDRSATTYWTPHNPGGDTARYFRQL